MCEGVGKVLGQNPRFYGSNIISPFSTRQPFRRDRKFIPSTFTPLNLSDTTIGKSAVWIGPIASPAIIDRLANTVPLAVCIAMPGPSGSTLRPALRATSSDKAVMVAPLSIRNLAEVPFISPSTQKWPSGPMLM